MPKEIRKRITELTGRNCWGDGVKICFIQALDSAAWYLETARTIWIRIQIGLQLSYKASLGFYEIENCNNSQRDSWIAEATVVYFRQELVNTT